MVKVTPVKTNPLKEIDQSELNRKLRHACPRIKRWNSRINVDADGDVHRIREQAINRSPVYVAVQRGSRNIQIRTKTKPKWWRKWIQEGKKYGFDESFATPIHIPSDAYRYKRQVSFSQPKKSPQTSPRRSLPVSPVKTGIHSPIKVSVLKNEQYVRSPKKEHAQRGVPLLTLTPVPLNQVLKKKARMVGQLSTTFGKKGRWVEQDASLLTVPGKQVLVYDTASETETDMEDERRTKKGGEILTNLLSPPGSAKGSPTETIKRLASAKRRETSPLSPKKTSKLEGRANEDLSESDLSDSHLSDVDTARIKRKIRAAGVTSLAFGGRRHHEDILEESEEERHPRERSARDKSATIRKMRATGTVKAALSPHKGEESPKREKQTPKQIKRKIKVIGKTSAALSPRKKKEPVIDEFGNVIEEGEEEEEVSTEKGRTGIGSIFRKIKTIARLSSVQKGPDAEEPTGVGIGSLMMRMRFLIRLSPRRKRGSTTEEEYEEEEEDEEGNITKVIKKRAKPKSVKSVKGDETEAEPEEEDEEVVPKESVIRKICGVVCPCICRKKEPELMEYQSGSQVDAF